MHNSGIPVVSASSQYQSQYLVAAYPARLVFFNEEMNEFVDLAAQPSDAGEAGIAAPRTRLTQNLDIIRRYKAELSSSSPATISANKTTRGSDTTMSKGGVAPLCRCLLNGMRSA